VAGFIWVILAWFGSQIDMPVEVGRLGRVRAPGVSRLRQLGEFAGWLSIGLAFGIAVGLVDGVKRGIADRIAVGVAAGLMSMVLPVHRPDLQRPGIRGPSDLVRRGTMYMVALTLAVGLTFGLMGGLVSGSAIRFTSELAFGLTLGVFGVVSARDRGNGFASNLGYGLVDGLTTGLFGGIAFFLLVGSVDWLGGGAGGALRSGSWPGSSPGS
jgi:hypothetical protein